MELLRNRDDIFHLSNRLALTVTHFAKGAFPIITGRLEALPVNRMLSILANPNGEANFIRDETARYELNPGTVFFIPAGYPAEVRLDAALQFVSIQFRFELYPGVELFTALRGVRPEYKPKLVERLGVLFESENRLLLALELKKHVAAFACDLLADGGDAPLEFAARFAPYAAVLDYIARHCTAKTRVEELAKVMHLSREAFSRRFAADTGISPKRFFDRQLVRRASELLHRPRATAREVAAELEFSSEFVFSRFFKARTGMPPDAYRKLPRI